MKTLYIDNHAQPFSVSKIAQQISKNIVSCWDFYAKYGQSKSNKELQPFADQYCREAVGELMVKEAPAIVVNSATRRRGELRFFYKLAAKHGYAVRKLSTSQSENGFKHLEQDSAKLGSDTRYFNLMF